MIPSTTDVLVVGSGIAGLSAALGAAREGASVTIATKATRPAGASTWWAQGGIAVARAAPEQFKRDIAAASSDTSDPDALDVLVSHADAAVRDVLLDTLDIRFDRNGGDSAFDYGREAAHSADRILHVDASTGKHIHVPFLKHLASHDRVTFVEDTAALDLIVHDDTVAGAWLASDGTVAACRAGATILATGGIGALYGVSTNPDGATGDGVAMALRAGADTADLEFVQFHPTVCVAGDEPFLVSEAVRGEGALLRNAEGERFMPQYHEDAELAPRDVVARAVEREHERTGRVILDVSSLDFAGTFPDLAALCDENDIDPTSGIPVQPAEHFLCGGIDVDTWGRASLDRLYAAGECARTGVHGANRLASTSLLEGLVWGLRAGADAATRNRTPPDLQPDAPPLGSPPHDVLREGFDRLHDIMDTHVGLRRTPEGLDTAHRALHDLQTTADRHAETHGRSQALSELRNAALVARHIAASAADNRTSVGTHHIEPSADSAPAPTR
ncbi:MAG: L-aspartate oxidase [Salinivenus sp.]